MTTSNPEKYSVENLKSRVLFCDKDMAIICKECGELCDPSDKENSVVQIFSPVFAELLGKGKAPAFCSCVNRLDCPVSGLCVIAFSREIFARLTGMFAERKQVRKMYWAVTEGVVEPTEDWISLKGFIRFEPARQKAFLSDEPSRKTKDARLLYRIAGHGDRYSYAAVELLTGRTHQIRAQLSKEKLIVKGDVKYGARRSDTLGGIRLHARYLELVHPVSKKLMQFEAPVPVKDPLWTDAEKCLEAVKLEALSDE